MPPRTRSDLGYHRGVRLAWSCLLIGCSYDPLPAEVVDGPVVVADAFNPAVQCPVEYGVTIPNQKSRYRVITGGRRSYEHHDDCRDDLPGATHLVAIDDQAELDGIEAALNATSNLNDNKAWVGVVQPRDLSAPGDGWLSITGGPFNLALWDGGEPNDAGDPEDDDENFAAVERNRDGVLDFFTDDSIGGMCECDGKPVATEALAAFDANR